MKKFGIDKKSFLNFIITEIDNKYKSGTDRARRVLEMGYSYNRYCKIRSNNLPSLEGLFELADVFDIDISMFFDKYRDCCKDYTNCNRACIYLTENLRKCLHSQTTNNT